MIQLPKNTLNDTAERNQKVRTACKLQLRKVKVRFN